jgi:glycolate oxidase
VFPGENSASLGGNVATNAGGMRAVRYGVTRHQVLGLTAVLGTGEVIRTGGKFVKATSGYDLTQLVIGSEGTLALATEATLRLHPRLPHGATVLVPFPDLDDVADGGAAHRRLRARPQILEYIDFITMAAITASAGLDLGVPQDVKDTAMAYLVVVLENPRRPGRRGHRRAGRAGPSTSAAWTCTSCRPRAGAGSSTPGRRRSGRPRP